MTRINDIKSLPMSEGVRKLNPHLFAGPGLTGKEPISPEHACLIGKALPPARAKYRSKWEAQFHEVLKARFHGAGDYVEHEPLRLRLADGAYYKPDFLVGHIDRPTVNPGTDETAPRAMLTFFEVKGHWREAARVRIKVAARLFPWAKFIAVVKIKKSEGGGWREEEFAP